MMRALLSYMYWSTMDLVCRLVGHKGRTRYCLRCARRWLP
jgi:hypothetical protein